jgi:hypothetical protein
MAHIVTVKSAPTDPGLLYLVTTPDMARTMGGFQPARYIGNTPPIPGASYVISTDDLPRLTVYCTNRGLHLVDGRDTPASKARAPWRERPLPECTHCGQPAARGARMSHCPNCGVPWEPVEVGPSQHRHLVGAVRQCASCGRDTPEGFTHCTHCGTRRE